MTSTGKVIALLDGLRAHDETLTELSCGDGSVLVCPGLQGRIFCQLDDQLIHRLDLKALEAPSPTGFNNLGGNSLWPAPEGGPYAFNYLPGSDQWLVQKCIGEARAEIVQRDEKNVVIEKQINLINRIGISIETIYRRVVSVPTVAKPATEFDLAGLTYRTDDTFEPLGSYSADEVLLAPWSLEQFPGADGVTVFCKVAEPENAINYDFYGRPDDRIAFGDGYFTFLLGGDERHQIGIKTASRPQFIAALDMNRSLLVLRRTEPQKGVYFNIADNDQPRGPYSAADLYSVFNGGALDFFELETIGAMRVTAGRVARSTLSSETTILKGKCEELRRYLFEQQGLHLEECIA